MILGIELPPSWVSSKIPSGYVLSSAVGMADVFLDLQRCAKVSVDGVDAGPATSLLLTVRIRPPSGVPEANGVLNWYVYDVATNNSAYAKWMGQLGLKPTTIEIIGNKMPHDDPSWMGDYSGKALNGTQMVYQYSGSANKRFQDAQYAARYFYGPDPKRHHWEGQLRYLDAGALGGTLEASESARLLELTQGNRIFPAIVEPTSWTHVTFASPELT